MNTLKTLSMAGAILAASSVSMACTTEETASNDTDSNATSGLCSGVTLYGSISDRRDVDWIEFQVASAGEVTVNLDHSTSNDFDWDLYALTGSALASGATSQVPETGSFNVTEGGTYFVKVSRYSGTGWYDLTVTFPEGAGGTAPDTDPTPEPDPLACDYGAAPSKPGGLKAYVEGDEADVCGNLTAGSGATLLMGGGSDVDTAFSQNVQSHVGSGVDTVVLRTSGTDAYNTYLQGLMASDSVATLIVDTTTKANSDYVDWMIRTAEFVFVAGGDQSEYLNMWENTKVQSALQHVYDKGGVIGGTSAGMALMSSTVYDPDGILGAVSSEVVTDYCHETMNFSNGIVSIPAIAKTVTDTHFAERDRMGRAMVFLARQPADHRIIAASEVTALFVEANGQGTVVGSNEIYVLHNGINTDLVQASCANAVIYNNVNRIKLLPGQSIDMNTLQHNGNEIEISIDGRNTQFYSPISPY